ncbi:MAG: exonuclease domain-containing protein [Gammaproteobacteria bacterium]
MAAAEDLPQDLVFVDLETTGGNPAYDRITEVGLIRVSNGELVEEWSSLVNPERPIPPYIATFTGISDAMVAAAPRFTEIAATVREKLKGAVFVAHNARFDYSFLRSEFLKADIPFSAQVLCTVKLSRRLFPEFVRHNLDAVMERNGLTCSARHRALGDAQVLHDFWCKLRREVPQPQLNQAVQAVLGAYKLPAHLRPGLADELPEGPGVYRFFGEGDVLLYVGKSNSLRARICRHFTADAHDSKDQRLGSQVRRVDWLETTSELGAMLREAEWIKTQRPLFNLRAKSKSRPHTLRPCNLHGAGGESQWVEAVAIDSVDLEDLVQCFGVFHSHKDARKALGDIAEAHQLCRKALRLEEAAGSCFAYQIGKCRGACIGKEPAILHSTRLKLALASLKLKPWPFPGRIALRERGAAGSTQEFMRGTELHVLDRWAYLGTARDDEELSALRARDSGDAFDIDVYRILLRYFAKHPKLEWIDLRDRTICT